MKTFYVASYGKGNDKGIYIISFNEETLELKKIQQILGSFSIHKNELILNNNYSSSGRSYTHLCISDDNKYIFAANYHVGATAAYKLENYRIDHKIGAVRHTGMGPDLLTSCT